MDSEEKGEKLGASQSTDSRVGWAGGIGPEYPEVLVMFVCTPPVIDSPVGSMVSRVAVGTDSFGWFPLQPGANIPVWDIDPLWFPATLNAESRPPGLPWEERYPQGVVENLVGMWNMPSGLCMTSWTSCG